MCPDKGEVGVGVEDFVWHCLVHNRVASAVHVTVFPTKDQGDTLFL